jgi:hypothetical protein
VGFLGGFLIFCLLGQMSEWAELKGRLVSLQSVWFLADGAVQSSEMKRGNIALRERAEERRVWSDLVRAIQERERAEMPVEFAIGTAALALLVGVGIIWPLMALEAPTNDTQFVFMIPWTFLLIAFAGFMYLRAIAVLRGLKSQPLWELVEGAYDTYKAEAEAWAERERLEQEA